MCAQGCILLARKINVVDVVDVVDVVANATKRKRKKTGTVQRAIVLIAVCVKGASL